MNSTAYSSRSRLGYVLLTAALCTLVLASSLVLTSCQSKKSSTPSSQHASDAANANASILATITMEDGKVMRFELDATAAPKTVANFAKLANEGFYDGLIFHRVIKGFMIQGGDPKGTGTGGPGYTIKGEFSQNGVPNPIKHERGVISMARASDPDSAGSQFFIMHQDSPHLDGQYAAFGHMTEGFDVLDAIAETPTGPADRPLKEQKIKSIRVSGVADSGSASSSKP